MIVEAGARVQLLAAGVLEGFAGLATNLVDRFQAVAGEAGHGHENPLDALPRQLPQALLRVRLEPFLPAKERLEGLRPLLPRPAEALDESCRGPFDMGGVGIAALGIANGDA